MGNTHDRASMGEGFNLPLQIMGMRILNTCLLKGAGARIVVSISMGT